MSRRLTFFAVGVSAVALALGLVAGGCVLDADGFTGGNTGGPDASVEDGSTAKDGGPTLSGPDGGNPPGEEEAGTADAGGPNLLLNGDFELGCAGWTEGFGFISESTSAHTGAKSCKFCMNTNFEAVFEQTTSVSAIAGETYFAELWLKGATPNTDLTAKGFRSSYLEIQSTANSGTPTSGPPIFNDWTRVTTVFKFPDSGGKVTLKFQLQQEGNPASVGNVICVFVDDAVLRRLQ